MFRRIKSVIDYHFSFLTPKEAFEAASQGDLAILEKFVENIQLQVKMIREELALENEARLKQGRPLLAQAHRNISKDYSVSSVSTNAHLWYEIYKIAACNNHVNIMYLLHHSSCINLNKMSVRELGTLLKHVIRKGSTETLNYIFTRNSFKKSKSNFPKRYIEKFMLSVVSGDKLESAKLLIKELNINLNDNRALYKKLIKEAFTTRMLVFLVEDCNVDKAYIHECLTELLRYDSVYLRGLEKKIVSLMDSIKKADAKVKGNKPSESQSAKSYWQTPASVLTREKSKTFNPTRMDTIDPRIMMANKDKGKTNDADPETGSSSSNMEPVVSNSPLSTTNDLQSAVPALPSSEDSNIFTPASIVAKDKGEADDVAPGTSSSSSNMEPVVSNSTTATPNNSQSTDRVENWKMLIQTLPTDYLSSNDNTDNLKRELESLKYQISQVQVGLSSQVELTNELRKKKFLMEQLNAIANGDEILLTYFMQLKSRLTDCYIASRILSSGMVERAPYLLTDKLKKLLESFGSLLTGVAGLAAFASTEIGENAAELLRSFGEGLHIGEFMKELLPNPLCELFSSIIESEEHRIERIASVSSGKDYTFTGLEYTAEVIALALTYIYRPQIKCLTEEGAKLLAQCSAERVMLLGKEGMVNRSNEWIPVVIALIGQSSIKQTKIFREIKIETKPEYQGRWTENGIHCKSGIMCLHENEMIYYANDETKHHKYGFRINGRSIAEQLYMMRVLASDQVSEHVQRTSRQYLSCNISNSPKVVEKTSCDDIQKPNEVPLIPTSFTSSADQNNYLYILRKLQEVESHAQALDSKVAKLESDNREISDEKAELEVKVISMQSNVTFLSKRQHEHQGKFENLRESGLDIDKPVEAGIVLLKTSDFAKEANSRGTLFIAKQAESDRRLGNLEQVVATLLEAQKLHGNK